MPTPLVVQRFNLCLHSFDLVSVPFRTTSRSPCDETKHVRSPFRVTYQGLPLHQLLFLSTIISRTLIFAKIVLICAEIVIFFPNTFVSVANLEKPSIPHTYALAAFSCKHIIETEESVVDSKYRILEY